MNLLTSDVVSVASERSGYLPQTPQTLSDKLRDLLMPEEAPSIFCVLCREGLQKALEHCRCTPQRSRGSGANYNFDQIVTVPN